MAKREAPPGQETRGSGRESKEEKKQEVAIPAPRLAVAEFRIRGTAPYVQHKFSQKAQRQIQEKQEKGPQGRKGAKREARNFDLDFELAQHIADDGWHGIPCSAFRAAIISACRLVGFKMTLAKLSVFVLADGYEGGTPLVRITKGKPEPTGPLPVRNENGVIDLRNRPMWRPGWEARPRVRFDLDQFSETDLGNLMLRVGMQVGIGEGRPDSPNSAGMDWGLFEVVGDEG